MELTDLEICKKIAEIEGVDWFVSDGVTSYQNDLGLCKEFNPLTDDALCFQLMVKYELDVNAPYKPQGETRWEVNYWIDLYSDVGLVYDENPNRAICMAIIEAHKESKQ